MKTINVIELVQALSVIDNHFDWIGEGGVLESIIHILADDDESNIRAKELLLEILRKFYSEEEIEELITISYTYNVEYEKAIRPIYDRAAVDIALTKANKNMADVLGMDLHVIEIDGGGEGGTEYVSVIVQNKLDNKYYSYYGYYYSYDGYYMHPEHIREVRPVEKTIIVYV